MDSPRENSEETDTGVETFSTSAPNLEDQNADVNCENELMECKETPAITSTTTTTTSVSPDSELTSQNSANINTVVSVSGLAEASDATPGTNEGCIAESSGDQTAPDEDYMPAEHLASDDSDVAGLYLVTVDEATASTSGYKRLDVSGPSSSYHSLSAGGSADSDDDSDSGERNLYDEMLQGNHSNSSSSSESGDNMAADFSLLHTGKARVKSHLLQNYWKREYGDRAGHLCHSNYVSNSMSNMSFIRRLKCVKTLNKHEGCVNALSFNQSGTLLASGSDDMKAIIWDMSTYNPYIVFDTGHKSNVFQTKFMPYSNDSQLVTCARDGQVRLSDLSTTGACRGSKRLALHKGSAHKLAVEYHTSHCLMSAGEDAVVYEIDLRQPKPNKLLLVRNGRRKIPLHSIDINPSNSQEFLVSGKDHFIRLYDRRRLPSTADNTDALTLNKFYPHKFSQSSPFKRDVTCALYNYDGSEVLGTYNDDDIYLFDNGPTLPEGGSPDSTRVFTGHRNRATIKGVSFFGARSEYVVSGSDCGNVFIWDKQSTQLLQLQKGDELGVVNILEPHPNFPYLATSGLDNDIKLFMPVAEDYVDLKPHAKMLRKNISERSRRQPEEIDGQLLELVMQQLQRARRRRQRQATGEDCENSSDSSDTSSSDDDGPMNSNTNCITS